MKIRRCQAVLIEPRERLEFDLPLLAAGGTGLHTTLEWVAFAAHQDRGITLNVEEVAVLGAVSPSEWTTYAELCDAHSSSVIDALLTKQLLIADEECDAAARDCDETIRAMHWRGLDAVVHRHSRWSEVDSIEAQRRFGEETGQTFLQRLGPPPPEVRERSAEQDRIELDRPSTSALDELLARRVTCRNFDSTREVSTADFSTALFRAFGARAVDEYAPDIFLLKKGAPSAGGLHPVEAYLLVQRVAGIEPGLYHYHPVGHALEPIQAMQGDELHKLAKSCLSGQHYFAQAHAVIALAARFGRNFWKYRNHAKAYRAVILDVGHLSQTLYLTATELGLAAFVTAGINELQIEHAFGLDAMIEGPLAMCGFGIRGPERRDIEFDPNHAVWPED